MTPEPSYRFCLRWRTLRRYLALHRVFLSLLLGAALPSNLAAQTITGRILADPSGLPVAGAYVLLIDSAGVVTRAVVSDSLGAYGLIAPRHGFYTVRVRQGNFASSASEPFHLSSRRRIEVDLHLPLPIHTLPAITVVAPASARLTGMLAGFQRRMEQGWGHFITRDEIARRGARRISDLLHGLPDVRVIPLSELQSTVRFGTELSRVHIGPFSIGEDGTPKVVGYAPLRCAPLLYVDGIKFGRADEVLDQVGPAEIEGIEVYRRSTEVPPEFGGLHARCGVILVWTRRSE